MRNERTRSLLIRSAIRSALAAPLVLPSALLHAQDADIAASASTTASAASGRSGGARYPPNRPVSGRLGFSRRRHQHRRTEDAARRRHARSPQERRSQLQRPAEPDFRRLDLCSRAVAARPRGRHDAGHDQRQASQPGCAGAGCGRDPTNALSQGADLSVLPSIAFGGLQILREGATAQYGTDAIAGVINYSLKKEEGVEINTRYGQYLDDGGDGDAKQVAGYLGVALGESGFISLAAEYNDDGGTFRNETRPVAVSVRERASGNG